MPRTTAVNTTENTVNCMILHPDDPLFVPADPRAMVTALQELEFAGEPLGPQRWRAGARFMEWVSLLGCSPYLRLEPGPDDEGVTHLRIPSPLPAPVLIAGDNLKPPRCPRCRRPFAGRQALGPALADPSTHSRCRHCGVECAWAELDWRRSAAVARWWIEVTGIHEAEAVPTPGLLEHLRRISRGPVWNHAYVRGASGSGNP